MSRGQSCYQVHKKSKKIISLELNGQSYRKATTWIGQIRNVKMVFQIRQWPMKWQYGNSVCFQNQLIHHHGWSLSWKKLFDVKIDFQVYFLVFYFAYQQTNNYCFKFSLAFQDPNKVSSMRRWTYI